MPTPLRNVRVGDDLWRAAQQRAAAEGTTVSAVLCDALNEYVSHGRPQA